MGTEALESKEKSADLESKAQEALNVTINEIEPELLAEQEKLENILSLKEQAVKDLQDIKK